MADITNPRCIAAARTTSATSPAEIPADTANDGGLLTFAIMVNAAGNVSTPAGWNLVMQNSTSASRQMAFFWRIYKAGDNFPPLPTWASATQSVLMLATWFGYDPDNPIEGVNIGGAASGTSHVAPSVTPTLDGSAAAWWWGARAASNVGSLVVARPSGTLTPRAEPGGSTGTGTGQGVQMNFGALYNLSAGATVTAGPATSGSTSVAWKSVSAVIRPAPNQIVTGQFLPFF